MIEIGLSQFCTSNPNIQKYLGSSDPQRKIFNAFYYSFIPKGAPLPGITLDRARSPTIDETLDAQTNQPGDLIEGLFQFGCCAQDDSAAGGPINPQNPSGYLSAALLAQALRRELKALATGNSTLPDGTIVHDVRFGPNEGDEFDAHYEVGGQGYLMRRVLKCTIVFQETNASGPAQGVSNWLTPSWQTIDANCTLPVTTQAIKAIGGSDGIVVGLTAGGTYYIVKDDNAAGTVSLTYDGALIYELIDERQFVILSWDGAEFAVMGEN